MNMNKFFMGLGVVAALSLAACSNDEPANPTPEKPTFGNDQAFLSVKVTEQTGRSRANTDGSTDDPKDFQDGTKYEESVVNTCDFYFYDADGKYVLTSNTFWKENGQDLPNIEQKGSGVVVLDQVKEKGYPTYMVTILNKPKDFTAPLTLEEMNSKLVGMATTTDGSVIKDNGFIMTTSSFAGQKMRADGSKALPYYFVNELIESDFMDSAVDAQDSDHTIKVYVERLAAKVTVNVNETNMTKVEGKENTYQLEISVAGGDNTTDDNYDYTAEYKLHVTFDGWGLNATPQDSYYMKNINTAWTNDDASLGFIWNSTDFHRSYWAQAWSYGIADQDKYNYFGWDDLTKKIGEQVEGKNETVAYTAENTHDADFVNTAANYKYNTTVLIKATVSDPKGKEGDNFVMYNGLLFKADRFMQYALSVTNTRVYTKDDKEYKPFSGYALTNGGSGNQVYTECTFDAATTYYTEGEGEDGMVVFDAAAQLALNESLKATTGEGYKGGAMYYEIPLRHLRELANGVTFGDLGEGHYGVVRNHCYAVTINSLAKLGHGVWDPSDKIIPENPPKDKEYFVGAEVNILSWRIVNNNVDL